LILIDRPALSPLEHDQHNAGVRLFFFVFFLFKGFFLEEKSFKKGASFLWQALNRDAGCWMLDAGCWMLDAGCWPRN